MKKCEHNWNGVVNTRIVPEKSHSVSMQNGTYDYYEEYVICNKCAEVKVIREWNKQVCI